MTVPVETNAHPAVVAWQRFSGASSTPDVERIRKGWKKRHARPVYRLSGIRAVAFPIIAKHCRPDEAARTVAIYEGVLADTALSHPELVGSLEDGKNSTWLFVEEVRGEAYRSSVAAHRRLAAHWLATMHSVASRSDSRQLDSFGYLYDFGPGRIFDFLAVIRCTLSEVLSNPVLAPEDLDLLDLASSQAETLERNWPALAALCDTVPRTLVHGDFCGANIRIRVVDGRPSLAVFDWEKAGWATPVLDLSMFLSRRVAPDTATYLDVIRPVWPGADLLTLRRLAYVGEVFRWIDAMRWEVERLRYEWVEGPLSRVAAYARRMDQICRAAPWRHNPALADGEWRTTA